MAQRSRNRTCGAIVTGPDVPAVQARVTQVLTAAGITPTAVTVNGPDPADPERLVTVTVQANFQVLTGNLLGTFSGTIPLNATSVMRHEAM